MSLHVSIVVHLAVLCATLCSQHACSLKPDTLDGPASTTGADAEQNPLGTHTDVYILFYFRMNTL